MCCFVKWSRLCLWSGPHLAKNFLWLSVKLVSPDATCYTYNPILIKFGTQMQICSSVTDEYWWVSSCDTHSALKAHVIRKPPLQKWGMHTHIPPPRIAPTDYKCNQQYSKPCRGRPHHLLDTHTHARTYTYKCLRDAVWLHDDTQVMSLTDLLMAFYFPPSYGSTHWARGR